MRSLFAFVLSILTFSASRISAQPTASIPESSADLKNWLSAHFAGGKIPPFSFVYGGKNSTDFISHWQFQAGTFQQISKDEESIVYTYKDPKTGLLVECTVTCFKDFPAIEWVLKFQNTSGHNSPILEKAAAIDQDFQALEKGPFTLYHAKGSSAERSDFQPLDELLKLDKPIYMTPAGGRSSDNTAFPFFNMEFPGHQGIVASIGWTGKWYAAVTQTSQGSLGLKAGMERMRLSLYPSESIRSPRICLLFWNGRDRMVGHNQFRQFILVHHSRKIGGQMAHYGLSGSFDYGDPAPCEEYGCLTEEFAVALVKRYAQFRILPETFWLDAGWYTGVGWDKGEKGKWWNNVGNWTPDADRFPHGLKPVADAVHAAGAKFMLWFEPERVSPGSRFDKEHPEWLIKIKGNDNYLFDLGNQDARLWLTKFIGDVIEKEGIDQYRQDFNFDPMPYWEAKDKPGRVGISEIRHIEGLYAFWDGLLERFPNLLIDNCASGGRRLDLETTSRSAPLWRTDYQYGEPNGYQCHTFGLNFYLPVHGTAIFQTDNYTFRSGLGATAVVNWEITGRNSEPIPDIQKRLQDFKNLRPYFYGDYYPLTSGLNDTEDDIWLAYQLNRPKEKDGIVLAFRRKDCREDSLQVKLSGLLPEGTYDLYYEDYGLHERRTGLELMKGILLTITPRPASLLLEYRLVD